MLPFVLLSMFPYNPPVCSSQQVLHFLLESASGRSELVRIVTCLSGVGVLVDPGADIEGIEGVALVWVKVRRSLSGSQSRMLEAFSDE